MTAQGESITQKGEFAGQSARQRHVFCCPCFLRDDEGDATHADDLLTESRIIDNQQACYEILSRDIHFWYGKMNLDKPGEMLINLGDSFLQMAFSIRYSATYRLGKEKKPLLALEQYQHNLLLIPAKKVYFECQNQGVHETVVISMTTDFFFRYLPQNLPCYAMFKNSCQRKSSALLSRQNLSISPKIMAIIYDILNCTYKGCLKRLFIESKIIELLAIQLEQSQQMNLSGGFIGLKKEELEKMRQVREIVLANLEEPLSLSELARKVGTNEYSLKKNFKQAFGTTVFGFIHAHRMEKAKEMLLKGELKIAEISKFAGYQHPTHFTNAFKRYFGFLPNKIKGS